mgnify:CR=1 FL=1
MLKCITLHRYEKGVLYYMETNTKKTTKKTAKKKVDKRSKVEKTLTPKNLKLVEEWAQQGLTDADIAINLKIAYSTLREWRKKYEKLDAALKVGKAVADDNVIGALYKRAIGYSVDEVTKERVFNDSTKTYEMVTTKIVTKHIIPEVTAMIFWLKNRLPNEWRDRHEIEQKFDEEDMKDVKTFTSTFIDLMENRNATKA